MLDNGEEALHDLAADVREQRNLIASEPARADRLRSLLRDWKAQTDPVRLRSMPRTTIGK